MRPSLLRRLTIGAAAFALIGAALLSSTGAVLATVPLATATSEAIPASYSPGNLAGFRGVYTYGDGSTLSKLLLSVTTSGTSGSAFISVTKNGATVLNACTGGTTVDCTFKQVRLADRIVVVVAFTPSSDATEVDATYAWSSSGSTSSDGGTSHGDTWPNPLVPVASTLNSTNDYAGGFVVGAGGSVGDIQVVTNLNPQATRLGALPANVAATVQDGSGAQPPVACTPTVQITCAQFGEWSNVTVGDGQTFGSAFSISIVYYSGTPKGFVHIYLDANGDPQQEFVGSCAKKSPVYPCFTWDAKTNTATIYTFHNGSYRGQ